MSVEARKKCGKTLSSFPPTSAFLTYELALPHTYIHIPGFHRRVYVCERGKKNYCPDFVRLKTSKNVWSSFITRTLSMWVKGFKTSVRTSVTIKYTGISHKNVLVIWGRRVYDYKIKPRVSKNLSRVAEPRVMNFCSRVVWFIVIHEPARNMTSNQIRLVIFSDVQLSGICQQWLTG